VINKGYENALFLVTKAIDKIMTGEDLHQQDLVISKLLRQDIERYKSLFPHVSAAIQLTNNSSPGKYPPIKGDTIQYIHTNSRFGDTNKKYRKIKRFPSNYCSTKELKKRRQEK
jgi:DNA polymerase elongation subunit (family B)